MSERKKEYHDTIIMRAIVNCAYGLVVGIEYFIYGVLLVAGLGLIITAIIHALGDNT